jgi:hypothetical protein
MFGSELMVLINGATYLKFVIEGRAYEKLIRALYTMFPHKKKKKKKKKKE